ncbi:MAG: SH3 domain-containing protein [Desulfosalsimonadaceae bacterium]
MKKKGKLLLYTLLCMFAAGLACHAAQNLWVTSRSADLKADRSISSATVAELARGTELTVEASESRWYRVRTAKGHSGWVYRGKVSEQPPGAADEPSGEEGGLDDMLGGLSGSSVDANAADSARSIRGLSPEAEAYARKTGTPEQSRKALDQVLSLAVSKEEVARFLKKGEVGEYAR